MIVVADTTPLRHLIAIGKADLLRILYGTVIIPAAVWSELHAESTPDLVKTWLAAEPDWVNIRSPRETEDDDPWLSVLDQGERDALRLAIDLKADLLLMDDREGRACALSLHLPVTGTLGILERADTLHLLQNFEQTLADLESSGFYLSARLRDAAIERHRRRSQ